MASGNKLPPVDRTARIKKNKTLPQPPTGVGNPGSAKVDSAAQKQPGVKRGGY